MDTIKVGRLYYGYNSFKTLKKPKIHLCVFPTVISPYIDIINF